MDYKNDGVESSMKKQIIEMLETVKDSLEIIKLKSEIILVDEIIDNINDSMLEKKNIKGNNHNYMSIDEVSGDSIHIENNSGIINNVNGNGSINVTQTIKNTSNIRANNKRVNRFISNEYKYFDED